MNKQIRELKEQAFNFVAKQNMTKKEYFWENIRHDRTLQDMVDQKFAELIVKDCSCVPTDMWGTGELDVHTAVQVHRQILKHFGVEE